MQDEILMSSLKINKVDNAETFKQLKSSEHYNSEEVYVLEDYISSSDIASGIEVHNNNEAAHEDIRALANEKLNDEQVQSKIDEALSGLDDFATVPVQDTAPENAEAYDLWIDTSVDGNSVAVGGVTSVNGQTGEVVIEIPIPPVTSVNGQIGDVSIEIPDISNVLLKSGGDMTGALTLAADPTNEMEAATKQYVDAQIAVKISDALEASY